MAKRKRMTGKDDVRHVRGEKGPPSATRNEEKQVRAEEGRQDPSRSVPKVSKHDAGSGETWGGDLH